MAGEIELKGKGQALRLGIQQALGGGPLSIFGEAAQKHDLSIRVVTAGVLSVLAEEFPNLEFRQRDSLSKREIHEKLSSVDARLGQALFVASSSIRPDGAITEVKDKRGKWRVILVGESKHQGNDIEKITAGVKQGKNKDQDFMVAGNAIERVHKNILEIRNFMIDEKHFPYVVFLQGSNFATESFDIVSVDGRQQSQLRIAEAKLGFDGRRQDTHNLPVDEVYGVDHDQHEQNVVTISAARGGHQLLLRSEMGKLARKVSTAPSASGSSSIDA